jgi:hypothetical protein
MANLLPVLGCGQERLAQAGGVCRVISALAGLKTTKVEISSSPLDAFTPAKLLALLDALEGMKKNGEIEIMGEVAEGESAAG